MSYFPNASISIINSPIPAYAGLVGGSDGTDLQALLTDSSGQLKVLVENPSGITAVTSVAGYREVTLTQGTQNLLQTTLGGNLRTRDRSTSSVDDCIVVGSQYNQIEFDFSKTFNAAVITNSTDGVYGTATQSGGAAIYATGAAASSYARGVSTQVLSYRPGHEVYTKFTAGFTVGGAAGSHQRIGMVNGTAPSLSDGFNIGYEGTVWGISHWSGGSLIGGTANVAPSVARSAFNGDQCTGAAGSRFTRAGVPEALNLGDSNIFRIHGAWFGTAPINLEVFSPDGEWVVMHQFQFPNSEASPYCATNNWNLQLDVTNIANTSNISMFSSCMALGTTDPFTPMNFVITDYTLAELGRSVLVGKYATAGSYLNVGVDASGNLFTDIASFGGSAVQFPGAASSPQGIPKVGIVAGGSAGIMDAQVGHAAPSYALQIGGSDGTDLRAILTTATGQVHVVQDAASYVPALNATGQVSITNAATSIIAANTSRQGVIITNTSTTVAVFIGASGVTATTGAYLGPGASINLPATSAFYGITSSSTATVSYLEVQ